MRVVKRYQMPKGADATTLAKYLPELWLPDTRTILLDVEASLIAVETDLPQGEEPDNFVLTVEEAVQKSDIEEIGPQGLSFLTTVHGAASHLLMNDLFPTYILVGDRQHFFHCLGLQDSPMLLGIPVEEISDYPKARGIIAGSKTKVAPILGITKSICFEVSA